MTKSCDLLNFDRLYATSYDAIWKKGVQTNMGQYVIIIDLFSHGTLHMWARIDEEYN